MEVEGAFFNTTDYKLTSKRLGGGVYGDVYVAKNINTNEQCAAKLIKMDKIFDGRDQMLFLRESLILHKLDHPSIVKFHGINFKSFKDDQLLQPTIITEYLPHGSLKDNLSKEKSSLSDFDWTPTKKYIHLLGISDAMRYLHEQGITHRDLKPENILVDSDYYPRICDFGLSKCFPYSLTKSIELTMTGQFGTPLYLPPEILGGEEHYDQSVDVYAFALIAYEIVTGEEPFSKLTKKIKNGEITAFTFAKKIIEGYRPNFPTFVPEKMRNLISRCWSTSPSERPTFSEIFNELSHDMSYFAGSLDEGEIQDYLEILKESNEERSNKNKNKNFDKKILEQEISELKTKIAELQHEHDVLSSSNDYLYSGIISLLGKKADRNANKALQKLKISSEQGNRYSSFLIGLLYETGEEIERDIKESFKYYDESLKQGNSKGLLRIGHCYHRGTGVKQDYTKAREYFEKAAKLGDSDALYDLGLLYINGNGVKQDYTKAREILEKSAELRNSDALCILGFLYHDGVGIKKDYTKTREYLEKSAELGSSYALFLLSLLYHNGEGVKQDYTKTRKYLEKSAELGNSEALYHLGLLYHDGKGVKQDYNKAREYFEKSAELDNSVAFYLLARLYENGQGVQQNNIKAREYYEKAAKLGDSMAKEKLKKFP